YLFLVLVLGLPLGELSRISFNLVTAVTFLDIIIGCGSSFWIVAQIVKLKKPVSPQAKAYSIFIGVLVLSLLFQIFFLPQSQLINGALYIVRYCLYGLLFFIVVGLSPKRKKITTFLLGCAGGILLFTGFLQFFFYPALRNLYYAGWDEHFYRMFGTFLDPNFFGLFLTGYTLFLVSLFQKQKNAWLKILFGLLILASFIGIVLTYSRTALISLAIGTLIMFWKNMQSKKVLGIISGFVVVAMIIIFLVGRHSIGNNLFRVTSSDARIGDAKNALIIFSQHPILGVGFNTYRYAQYRYGFMKPSSTQPDHGASGADNSLLFVLATTGIIGFAAFLYLLFVHMRILLQKKNRLGLATICSFIIGSFFINGLFYPFILVWLWVILGLSENTSP
ncbi:MAG TPA: O-antigen ligase family protein, partial [Candidatus Saccharimonadales bacterium]|nr:O-antigen ligase family protein [Candidatus Saccharimonadales bacterium]